MFSIIFHAGTAVFFLVMSLAAGAGILLYGHEYTTGHFWNMTGLCIVSSLVWSWEVAQAKEAWYILRNDKKGL
ncbi:MULTISPECIES: hypothetical protein [Enterobacterales]|uniref:hypothetical protein n=1 Tax=Enterobacterales TaxID=91347 RepID=UPI002940AFFC|nr:hypothetical protein [Salmonella enterica subsp. enterica serovar Johannesburg]HEC8634205.1 hypothetical protein [Salmonella enterica subsp. enterica serovar Johannesburg]HEC8725020.1 hypothetical protein [Salmonella enterica subsp. enterica serovar Johannesburg]HED0316079.1 hypothetical protein [Salmonella enterica subsp. enterica serovar Johannesburg]